MKNSKKMQDQKKKIAHKAGGALKKVGTKIANAGNSVYKAGNKLEHSLDKK